MAEITSYLRLSRRCRHQRRREQIPEAMARKGRCIMSTRESTKSIRPCKVPEELVYESWMDLQY